MVHKRIAAAIAAGILMAAPLGLLGQDNSAPANPPTASDQPSQPSRWPMAINTPAGPLTMFQPQLEDFSGDTIKARAAVSITPNDAAQPIFGAIWLQSRVETDRVARTVRIVDLNITREKFPGSTPPISQDDLNNSVRSALLAQPITLSLDQLLAQLETVNQEQSSAKDIQSPTPKIIVVDHPAVKVQYDGTPRMQQVPNSDLMRVVNTPFFVVLNPSERTYYLKGGGLWFSAPDPMGPFNQAANVPGDVRDLANSSGYQDPQQPIPAELASTVQIVTATTPTELIWTDGPAQMSTIQGTNLLYVANTQSDLFLKIDTQQWYVLLSGRWFAAPSEDGPYALVPPDKLPADFSKIPPGSPKGNVLADVPNTQADQDALADQYIPQTAAIDTHNFDQPPVQYEGDPSFEPIQGTPLQYAVNTDAAVVLCDGQYYCCYDGCWYVAGAAAGPWGICFRVPPAIYTIPPSCPLYPCRFCYVYGYTPDVVYVGYTPGYLGCYDWDGCVVYGTGYDYSGWWHDHYFPRPLTYGFGAQYDAYLDRWGFNFGVALGGGNLWVPRLHPSAGRGGIWFGFGGYRPVLVRNDVYMNPAIMRLNNANVRIPRGDEFVRNIYTRRNDVRMTAYTSARPLPADEKGRAEMLAAQAAHPGAGRVTNDVYTDRQGNVYRHTASGWEARASNNWQPMSGRESAAEAARSDEENRASANRAAGAQEQQQEQRQAEEDRAAQDQANSEAERNAQAEQNAQAERNAAQQQRDEQADLDRAYRARQEGENRQQTYEPSRGGGEDRAGGEDRGGGGGGFSGGGGGGDHGGGSGDRNR